MTANTPAWRPDERPRLAYVVHSLNPGGTEKLVVEMSLAFAAEFSVHVFCLDEPGLWAEQLRAAGIAVFCLWRQPGLDLVLSFRLARELRSFHALIVHAHQCTPWFYAALARILFPRPRLILEEHGRFFPEVDNPLRRLVGAVLLRRLTHRCIAVSKDVKTRLIRYEGLRAADVEVIYNGIRPNAPLPAGDRNALRRGFGFESDDFVVGTVGRFEPVKNLPLLVHAIGRAAGENPRIRGLLIGSGEQLPAIRRLIEALGLAARVQLSGFRNDARELVKCLDLFVLSSLSEGTSVALLEAMAASVPVAVTAVGGNPEIVLTGETGWVVPSEDLETLTAVVLEAAREPALRARYSAAGRQRAEAHFSMGQMIGAYRQLYRSLGRGLA